MTSPLRIGLVGAGYVAAVHSAAYKAVSGTFPDSTPAIDLTAVVDIDRSRAERLGQRWGWAAVSDDWHRVTRGDDIDVVDVSVPNGLHADVAIDALEHGKHVVCEKPLAADVASAERMVHAAVASGLVADVCFYYRLWPAVDWARRQIEEGRIGRVVHMRGWMLQDYARRPGVSIGWRADRSQSGAGALGDLGSHIFDVMRSLAGDARRVCAITLPVVERERGRAEVDDLAMALLEFAGGASGVLEAGWAMTGHKCDLGFDVVGSEGAIRFSWERSNEVEIFRDDGSTAGFERVLIGPGMPNVANIIAVAGQGLGYRDAFTIGLGSAIQAAGGQPTIPRPSFHDGLAACRFVQAAQESAESGRWVAIPGDER